MKEKEPQNESQEALPESEDAVWELLKQAREPRIDPWFVQKVQAAIKQEPATSIPWWKLILSRPMLGLGVAAAVLTLVAVGSWFFRPSSPTSIMPGAVVAKSSADTMFLDEEDESLLADIDDELFWLESSGDVLSSDDASLLDEETVERLLF